MRIVYYLVFYRILIYCISLYSHRYASRCLMIEYFTPALSFSLNDYIELVDLINNSSSCAGFCVSLGEEFFLNGIDEVDDIILPMLRDKAGSSVMARVLPSYAILYWFCTKVKSMLALYMPHTLTTVFMQVLIVAQ